MNKEPLRSNNIRESNEKLVLNLIHLHKEISQSEIVTETGLKPSTIYRIFKNLESNNLIRSVNSEKVLLPKKGRRPVSFGLQPTTKYAVAIDFYSGSITVIVIDFAGEPVFQQTTQTKIDMDADEVTQSLIQLVKEAVQKSNVPWEKVLGIGVGFPGVIDLEKGRIMHLSGIKGMHHYDLSEKMERELRVPVLIQNNSALIALSEYRYGKVRGVSSVLSILIRAGVGGSFIQDGQLFINRNRSAYEIGHLSLVPEGRLCVCGAKGCLETYLSEGAIISDLREISDIQSISDIEKALIAKDPAVLDNLIEKACLFSQGIRSLSAILNPEVCLIVTRSITLSEFLAEKVIGFLIEMNQRAQLSELETDVVVLADQYDPLMAGRGACDLVFDRFFQES